MKKILNQKILKNPFTYLIIFILGFIIRIINLQEGLWLDEIWSMVTSSSQNSISSIIDFCKKDTHPPFFDVLLNLFLRIFGDDEINGRILALIIGCIGIPATLYYAVQISKNWLVGFIAFTIINFNFFHIYYSGEGRFYTFLYFLSLIIICELYLFIRDKRFRNLMFYAISSVLIIYTHYYGAILLFVLSILTFILWLLKEISLKTFLTFIIANIIILLLYAPWIPFMFGNNNGSSWMTVPRFGSFFEYVYLYTGKNPIESLFFFTGIFFSIKLFKTNVKFYTLMLGTILLGFITPFLVSHFTIPMLHSRYTIIYFPCIILLASFFLGETKLINLKVKMISFSVIVISSLINFFFINKYFDEGRSEPWREIAQDLTRFNKDGEEKIYTSEHFYLNYYLKKHGLQKSTPYTASKQKKSFWYLHTPYEKISPIDKNFIIIEKINYKNKFKLIHYRHN